MNKVLSWIVIAIILILIGTILFAGVMIMMKWDFTKLSTNNFVTEKYEFEDEVKNITIVTDTADIVFQQSENSKITATCFEQENVKHLVEIKESTLEIKLNDTRKWYEHIGINFKSPQITVELPQGAYGDILVKSQTGKIELPQNFSFENIEISGNTGDVTSYASAKENIKIKTSTGKINVENVTARNFDFSISTGKVTISDSSCTENLKIEVSTGKTLLTNVNCKSLTTNGATGDIELNNVIAAEKFFIERSTGKVTFDRCDAQEISVKTDTGDVKGTLLSDKFFIAETDTGKVNVPKTTSGGTCEISTDTGDIKIELIQ